MSTPTFVPKAEAVPDFLGLKGTHLMPAERQVLGRSVREAWVVMDQLQGRALSAVNEKGPKCLLQSARES